MYSKSFNASRGNKPPGSGQPVPGTNPASIQSISKEIYTQSDPSVAYSIAKSAASFNPISQISVTVKTFVLLSLQIFTPSLGTCQPPIPN